MEMGTGDHAYAGRLQQGYGASGVGQGLLVGPRFHTFSFLLYASCRYAWREDGLGHLAY